MIGIKMNIMSALYNTSHELRYACKFDLVHSDCTTLLIHTQTQIYTQTATIQLKSEALGAAHELNIQWILIASNWSCCQTPAHLERWVKCKFRIITHFTSKGFQEYNQKKSTHNVPPLHTPMHLLWVYSQLLFVWYPEQFLACQGHLLIWINWWKNQCRFHSSGEIATWKDNEKETTEILPWLHVLNI